MLLTTELKICQFFLQMSKILLLKGCLLSCCCTFVPFPESVGWKKTKHCSSSFRLIQYTYMVPLCSKKWDFCRTINKWMHKIEHKALLIHSNYPLTFPAQIVSVRGFKPKGNVTNQTKSVSGRLCHPLHSTIKSKHFIKNVPRIWLCDKVTWVELSCMCSWSVRQSRELLRKGYYRIIIVQNMNCCIMQESTLWFFQLPVCLNFQLYRCCLSA